MRNVHKTLNKRNIYFDKKFGILYTNHEQLFSSLLVFCERIKFLGKYSWFSHIQISLSDVLIAISELFLSRSIFFQFLIRKIVFKITQHLYMEESLMEPLAQHVALNTPRDAWPLSSRTALPIWENHHPELGEPLCETLVPTVLSKSLSPVWGNQCSNLGLDVLLNQRGAALPPLMWRFY